MATEEKIVYSVELKGDKAGKSLSDLKKEFKETQAELGKLKQGTKEYVKQLEKLGGIKDDIGDLNQTIKAFNPEGKIQAVGNVASGLASSFAAAQGAAALFGTENKDLEKTLVKVQAAMAFQQGIQGLASLGDGFKVLGAIIKSNPLFMIVAAVAAIGTALFALKDKIGIVGKAFDAIGDAIGWVTDKIKEFTDWIGLSSFAIDEATAKQGDAYKKQGDAVQARYDKEIRLLKAAGKDTLEVEKLKQKALIETAQLQGKLLIEAALARGEWADGEEARITAYIKIVQDAYTEIEVIEATQLKNKQDKDKAALESQKKNYEEDRAALTSLLNEKLKLEAEFEANKKAQRDKANDEADESEASRLEREFQKSIDDYNASKELKRMQSESSMADKLAFLQWERDEELKNKELTENEKALIRAKYAEQERELTEVSAAQSFAIAKASNDGLQALSDIYFMVKTNNLKKGSAEELKAAKQQFKINKALAITSATIQGVQAVLAAYSSGSAIPVVGAVTGPLFAALAGVTVAANIAKIARTKFDDGGAGASGGGAPVTGSGTVPNIAPPTQGATQLNPDGTVKQQGDNKTPTIRAVVVETEVTKVQGRVSSIETNAKL